MTKTDKVKEFVLTAHREVWTVNSLHFALTGSDGAARWRKPILEVGKSTVRRALDGLVSEGKLQGYYKYGHCFDEFIYERI